MNQSRLQPAALMVARRCWPSPPMSHVASAPGEGRDQRAITAHEMTPTTQTLALVERRRSRRIEVKGDRRSIDGRSQQPHATIRRPIRMRQCKGVACRGRAAGRDQLINVVSLRPLRDGTRGVDSNTGTRCDARSRKRSTLVQSARCLQRPELTQCPPPAECFHRLTVVAERRKSTVKRRCAGKPS